MKIDLTYKCSMGCSHCMSACTENGEEMKLDVLKDVMGFIKTHKIPYVLLSGGELFEHSRILDCMRLILENTDAKTPIMITTNGRILSSDIDMLEKFKEIIAPHKKRIMMQVTDDDRFYPTKLDSKQRYRLEKLGAIIEPVPSRNPEDRNRCLYPQGRALENFTDEWYDSIAPKCINCRLMVKQGVNSFHKLVMTLMSAVKMCTPTIAPDGSIKLGESALCPACSSIYKSDSEIIEDIRKFDCRACKYSWEKAKHNTEMMDIMHQ